MVPVKTGKNKRQAAASRVKAAGAVCCLLGCCRGLQSLVGGAAALSPHPPLRRCRSPPSSASAAAAASACTEDGRGQRHAGIQSHAWRCLCTIKLLRVLWQRGRPTHPDAIGLGVLYLVSQRLLMMAHGLPFILLPHVYMAVASTVMSQLGDQQCLHAGRQCQGQSRPFASCSINLRT